MLDIKYLLNQFAQYSIAKQNYNDLKKACTKYFSKYESVLISEKIDFESRCLTDKEIKDYLCKNDILRRFFHMKFLKDYYEEEKNRYKHDLSHVPIDKRYILIKEELKGENIKKYKGCLINLEDETSTSFDCLSIAEISFVLMLLDNANSYIGEIKSDDLSLILNIYSDIKNKNYDGRYSNSEIYKEYIKTLRNADVSKNEIFQSNLKKIILKAKEDLQNNLITYEEYKIIRYMYTIVTTDNIEKLYLRLDNSDKKIFLKAYKKLSSYEYFEKYQVYYRSSSQIINDDIYLKRRKKK